MSSNESAIVVRDDHRALTAVEIRSQVNLIQEVMREVMISGVHFGTVPGTAKPSLYKPGAEKISMTFKIAVDPQIEADLSTEDIRHYRIRANATSQSTGLFLGSALGTCSSNEEKYKWREAVCQEEFEETPIERRRKKWKKGNPPHAVYQIRTEPADIDNTVLKMAVKRAVIAVILQVTAASDIFTQDVEDLPEEIRHNDSAEQTGDGTQPPTPKEPGPGKGKVTGEPISEPQRGRAFAIGKSKGWTTEQYRALIKKHGFDSDKDIPKNPKTIYDNIVAELERGPNAGSQVPAGW